MLQAAHVLFAGSWIATVLVEALFERALLGQGRDKELILARLHWKVDLLVEFPLLLLVALTGGLLLSAYTIDGLMALKLVSAGTAILANLYCIWMVRRRLAHAEAREWNAFDAVDRRQHQFGAVVLLGLITAVALGAGV